jgi:uncharacterized protein YgiM (DUF1202 family)
MAMSLSVKLSGILFGAAAFALFTNSVVAADVPSDSLKLAPGVVKASGYETPSASGYIVANSTSIYSEHVLYSAVTGELKRGEKVPIVAKVKGWDWVLVGKDGVGIGYVPTSMVSPEDKYVP